MRLIIVATLSNSLQYTTHATATKPMLSRSYTLAAAAMSFIYKKRLERPLMSSRLAGRQWLAGGRSSLNKYPQYIASPRDNFPAVYTLSGAYKLQGFREDTMENLSKTARDLIERELHIHGAILFRGMPLEKADDFSRFMSGLGYSLSGYEGGVAVRHKVARSVLTASNDPPSYTIEPHNEMSYTDTYPSKIFFYCEIPPGEGCGGETVITDVRKILPRVDNHIVDKVREHGIQYVRHLPSKSPGGYTSWQEAFFTENKADIERFMEKRNRTYCWNEDGSLSYWYTLPAFVKHPKTGEEVWFNQLHSHNASYFKDHPTWKNRNISDDRYPFHSYYGDGSVVEPGTLQHLRDIAWQLSVGFQLKKSDMLVLDNVYTQHARLGFTGQRKLLVSIAMD
ncbi:dapdiamide synthesis protein DdaC-like [Saccoglossus kowalevskii]